MATENDNFVLIPPDAAAVDELLGGEAGAASAERRARVQGWLGVLESSPMPEPAGDLVTRTLACVQAERMKVEMAAASAAVSAVPAGGSAPVRQPSQWRRRVAEIGAMAIAASLLLVVSIEGLGTARKSEARTACAGNLKQFSNAFTTFAHNENGALPAMTMPVGFNWLTGSSGGSPDSVAMSSNAANLVPLVSGGLVPAKAMFCAGAGVPGDGPIVMTADHMPAIGYSYRDMAVSDKPKWEGDTIVLTDKNPVFGAQVQADAADKNSPNHDGKGTYVLRADSTVTWETQPNVGPGGDNIWTIGSGKERLVVYTGREMPAGGRDVFVCP